MTDQLTCSTCGKPIDASMRFCRYCGAATDAIVNPATPSDEDMPTMALPAQPSVPAQSSAPAQAAAPDQPAAPVQAGVPVQAVASCPTCGSPINPGHKFCKSCGTPVSQGEPTIAAAPPAQVQVSCPACGYPANPGSKFCKSCGSPIPQGEAIAAAPVYAPPMPGGVVQGGGNSGFNAQDSFSKAQSSLDNFMGASIDPNMAGATFNANAFTLEGVSDQMLANAFSFFGKTYTAEGQPSEAIDPQAVARRKEIEASEELARSKEQRDFSINESGTFYGEFATKLQAGVAPRAAMVESAREEASKHQYKNRLKHAVALGDMDKREAVELADK